MTWHDLAIGPALEGVFLGLACAALTVIMGITVAAFILGHWPRWRDR